MHLMPHEEMPDSEKYGIAILDIPFGWSEKILESKKLANLLIIMLIILTGFAMLGIGLATTQPFAPAHAAQVAPDSETTPNP